MEDYIVYLQDNKEINVRAGTWYIEAGHFLRFNRSGETVAVFSLDNISGFKVKEG